MRISRYANYTTPSTQPIQQAMAGYSLEDIRCSKYLPFVLGATLGAGAGAAGGYAYMPPLTKKKGAKIGAGVGALIGLVVGYFLRKDCEQPKPEEKPQDDGGGGGGGGGSSGGGGGGGGGAFLPQAPQQPVFVPTPVPVPVQVVQPQPMLPSIDLLVPMPQVPPPAPSQAVKQAIASLLTGKEAYAPAPSKPASNLLVGQESYGPIPTGTVAKVAAPISQATKSALVSMVTGQESYSTAAGARASAAAKTIKPISGSRKIVSAAPTSSGMSMLVPGASTGKQTSSSKNTVEIK